MGDVVDLQKRKEDDEPHTAGPMVCLTCRHEWIGVVPTGVQTVVCPHCETEKGVRSQYVMPSEEHPVYECHCGSWVFAVIRQGCTCVNCGQFHSWDDIAEG